MSNYLSLDFIHPNTGVDCVCEIDFNKDSVLNFDIKWSSNPEYLNDHLVYDFEETEKWCRLNSGLFFENVDQVFHYLNNRLNINNYIF